MLKSYFRSAARNLAKYKEYSIINILGLAIGMACVLLILLFVREELSYDTFHVNHDRIYRLNMSATHPQTGVESRRAVGPYRLATELREDFPDIPHIVRIMPQGRSLVKFEEKGFYEERLAHVDPNIFEVFTIPLLQGDPATALEDPFSVVITEDVAARYFGNSDPIGQILNFNNFDFKVTGILASITQNTQFGYDMLASTNCANQVFSRIALENWGEGTSETFVMLPAYAKPSDYTDRLQQFVAVKLEAWQRASPKIEMQPLSEIYLHSTEIASYETGGDITYVYAFSAIAVFILVIACINFMNLATARSANRAKEVGLRKVVGAQKSQLIWQFLIESIVLAILSLLIALVIVRLTLPAFNDLSGAEIELNFLKNAPMLLGLLAVTLFVGILAGSYPALFLAAFEPVSVLSGLLKRGAKAGVLRRILVTFQFAISILLIVVTSVVYKQLDYAQNIDLGFEKEQLLLIPGTPDELRGRYTEFRNALMKNPNIVNAAGSSRVPPGSLRSSITARPEGIPEDQQVGMQTVWTDFDFIETVGFEIAAGRSFSRGYPTDGSSGFLLNEAAVRRIGWTNETAIGKSFGSAEIKDWQSGQWEDRDGQVIGVLRDFHFESLREKIVPTVYFVAPYMAWNYVIRLKANQLQETIAFIKDTWHEFVPNEPIVYQFVDEAFEELYRNEERQAQIFGIFASLAIVVACLGLVGLASFTAEQRAKEVGIRKVLGATVSQVVLLITKEFTWLVLFAFAIAVPAGYFFMDSWLQAFAYHISLDPGIFGMAGAAALAIAWMTVSFQAIKVALTNPASTLRYE